MILGVVVAPAAPLQSAVAVAVLSGGGGGRGGRGRVGCAVPEGGDAEEEVVPRAVDVVVVVGGLVLRRE